MSNPAAYYMYEILGLRYNVIDSVSNLTWLWVWVHAGALDACASSGTAAGLQALHDCSASPAVTTDSSAQQELACRSHCTGRQSGPLRLLPSAALPRTPSHPPPPARRLLCQRCSPRLAAPMRTCSHRFTLNTSQPAPVQDLTSPLFRDYTHNWQDASWAPASNEGTTCPYTGNTVPSDPVRGAAHGGPGGAWTGRGAKRDGQGEP